MPRARDMSDEKLSTEGTRLRERRRQADRQSAGLSPFANSDRRPGLSDRFPSLQRICWEEFADNSRAREDLESDD